jgi:hypothetical protein
MCSSSNEEGGYKNAKIVAQKFYTKIENIWCPPLGVSVVFNRAGFQHLVRRGRIQRPKSEQKRRFALLVYVRDIISDQYAHISYEKKFIGNTTAEFWIFNQRAVGVLITVVLRRIGNGNVHFFSVYQNKNPS